MKLFDFVDCNCYIPAFFSIKMNNTLSVDDMFGTVHEHELFHEYIHFLQDITTSYGLMNTGVVYEKIIASRYYIRNSKRIKLPLETVEDRIIDENISLIDLYLQYTESEKLGDVTLNEVHCENKGFTHPTTNETVSISCYELQFSDGNRHRFGAHAILEGIAHSSSSPSQ